MATGRMEFLADTIMQHANFCFVLPNDVQMDEVQNPEYYNRPTLSMILLHGLTGTDTDWLYGGIAQKLSIQYNLAVFMPTTGNSFYLDRGYQGGNFASFIGEELPEYIRKTFGYCKNGENTLIAGLSMGGFGAIHTALAFPEQFSGCIALSSALVIHEIAEYNGRKNDIMPAQMVIDTFGDPGEILDSEKNPEVLFKKLKSEGKSIPKMYLAIGTEDTLYDHNQEFRKFLQKEKADFFYEEGPGKHDWNFWNEYLPRGVKWLLNQMKK